MSVEMVEAPVKNAEAARPAILQKNRVFLDFFWDIAKPEQDVRLKAVEQLLQHLQTHKQEDELEYTFKRLVDGLGHTREVARPGFSLALGQVLASFTDVSLQSVLDRIKEKHNLQKVKKKLVRNAAFGNLFGVVALHQSGRLSTEPPVVLGCIQLLQSLSQQRQHLKDLPTKTMADILNQIPEDVFEEVLLGSLQSDLASAFSTPEQLQLLLVSLQRFPQTLKPKKLKKLLGCSTIINADNIPRLTEVLKMAARSTKKDCVLPAVVLDLLRLSLKEDSFLLLWDSAIVGGLMKDPPGPSHYLSFRLLGAALPLLSTEQLKHVLSGDVMLQYGTHVVSAQKASRFKLAPEMESYVSEFLRGCADAERQLAVMVGFSSLTNQGYPVVPSVWRVVQHLQPAALNAYVAWLKSSFLRPPLEALLDFSTRKQKDAREREMMVFRLRKWFVARLASIIDNQQLKKEEDLVMGVARFVFFHAFFSAKKASADIPETEGALSVPLDEQTRAALVGSFFGLLLTMHHLPAAEDAAKEPAANQKRVLGVTADGTMWIQHLAQYADLLLKRPAHAASCQPFSPEQRQAWDSMLASVESLRKKAKKGQTDEGRSFQQLFLLVGMHLFKAPDELLDIMKDLQSCVDKAQEKKTKKKKKKKSSASEQEEEPEWVEVMVDILLSLLSQPSRHIRQVCKTVFSSICPHVNAAALTAILDVLDPENDEDGTLVVTEDGHKSQKMEEEEEDEEEEMEEDKSEDDSDGDDEEEEEDDDGEEEEDDDIEAMEEEEEEPEEVDQNFRLELMKVLQQQNALATEEDGSSDEDMDDDAMMELDKSLAALFSEQKKKTQAKKDEKVKVQKEKSLRRDFRIKVLDLLEVFVARQAGSPLVLGLVEPLLSIIERGMSSGSEQQEQDFLRRAADIFRNQLCRSKVYCRTADDRQGELHDLLDKLMTKAQKLSDSSVCLYYFSASLYIVKVLRGAPAAESTDLSFMGNVDMERVSAVFRDAMSSFMSHRKSPLTTQMFTDLFTRFPVLCVSLLDTAVQNITSAVRDHQQGQACVLVLRALQSREVKQLLSGAKWEELCVKVMSQLTASLQQVESQTESKVLREKLVKVLELCNFLLKVVRQQNLSLDLDPLQQVLQSLTNTIAFKKTGKLEDTYWMVMKHFGVTKPKVEKTKPEPGAEQPPAAAKKKKGFLPESKKRKKRNQPVLEGAADKAVATATPPAAKKKKKQKGQAEGTGAAAAAAAVSQGDPAKKKKKKQKRPAEGAAASQGAPAKKKKTQQQQQQQSNGAPAKKNKKKKKKNAAAV